MSGPGASTTSSSRLSPDIKRETDDGSDSVNASASASKDPYAFPRDDLPAKAPDASPVTVLKRLPKVPSPAVPAAATEETAADVEMADAPPSSTATSRDTPATSDVPMKDVEEASSSERPLKGVKTVPKQPEIGEKKPPQGTATNANSNKENSTTADSSATLDLPPSTLSQQQGAAATASPAPILRKPHKLKRLRDMHKDGQEQQPAKPAKVPSKDEQMRDGLRRSIALALDHVGFTGSSNEALESFLLMTETYLESLVQDVSRFSYAARRNRAIPTDFDTSLGRFNLRTSALRPHLRNPVAKSKLAPTYFDPLANHLEYGDNLPLLGRDLSGKPEKDAKSYIPSSFPDFPSIHTYRYTPVDVDTVTVKGSGLVYEDGTPVVFGDEEDGNANGNGNGNGNGAAGPGANDGNNNGNNNSNSQTPDDLRSDPKRIREAAAIEAKQAEEALRGLMRASKINKLKEVRSAATRHSLHKERFSLWESAMRELICETKPNLPRILPSTAMREEIADQSMMVDADKTFHRKEIPRLAKKQKTRKV